MRIKTLVIRVWFLLHRTADIKYFVLDHSCLCFYIYSIPTFLTHQSLTNRRLLEIFPSRLFTSVEPTMLNSISSSNVMSNTFTLHPTLILSKSTSSSTTTSAFFQKCLPALRYGLRYLSAHLLPHRILRSLKGLPALWLL